MRGADQPQTVLFSFLSMEDRIPADHPLRTAVQSQWGCFGGPDGGFGILPFDGSNFTACIHDGMDWILYYPVASGGWQPAQIIPGDTVHGNYRYQLLELFKSPIWTAKADYNNLFSGNLIVLSHSIQAYDAFYSFADPNQANPPYAWQGGAGCHDARGDFQCWYSFGVDGTTSFQDPTHWPVSARPGDFLIDPANDFSLRFSGLPASPPYRYNPYVPSPPNYYGAQPIIVTIYGPDTTDGTTPSSYSATAQWGVAPYTYQWSGALPGTGSTVSGVIPAGGGDLFLDVWDAAGQHVSVAKFISGPPCPPSPPRCYY